MRSMLFRLSIWSLLFVVLPLVSRAQSEQVHIRVCCDTSVMIGDSMSLKVQYSSSNMSSIRPKAMDPKLSQGLEFYTVPPLFDTVYDATSKIYTLTVAYPFSIYQEGIYTLPALAFEIMDSGGKPVSLFTDSLKINVSAPLVDTTQAIKDIHDIIRVPFFERLKETYLQYYPYIWASLALLLLLSFGIWYYLKRRKANGPVFVGHKPELNPREQALLSLKQLKEKQLWQHNQVKAYHTELTDILRVFIDKEYHLTASEMTSDELLEEFRKNYPEKKDVLAVLRLVLQTADLVKFAKSSPLPTEHEDCFQAVFRFVEKSEEQKLKTQENE